MLLIWCSQGCSDNILTFLKWLLFDIHKVWYFCDKFLNILDITRLPRKLLLNFLVVGNGKFESKTNRVLVKTILIGNCGIGCKYYKRQFRLISHDFQFCSCNTNLVKVINVKLCFSDFIFNFILRSYQIIYVINSFEWWHNESNCIDHIIVMIVY